MRFFCSRKGPCTAAIGSPSTKKAMLLVALDYPLTLDLLLNDALLLNRREMVLSVLSPAKQTSSRIEKTPSLSVSVAGFVCFNLSMDVARGAVCAIVIGEP